MTEDLAVLTEKEKEALRLILRGHDAKSSARELDLSVHTVNGRLRDARRKLGVTSSKEAARLLLAKEGPQNLAGKDLGDAQGMQAGNHRAVSSPTRRRLMLAGGLAVMLTLSILTAFALIGQPAAERPVGDPATAIETVQIETFEAAALEWLELVDKGDWEASFAEAGRPFRDPNTTDLWREASEKVRVPLGAMVERQTRTVELVEPREGVGSGRKPSVVVRFATQFENRADVIESVTLEQGFGVWKVIGYEID